MAKRVGDARRRARSAYVDAHARELAEAAQPSVQLAVSRGPGAKGRGAQHATGLVQRRRHVDVAVDVHAAEDATR